MTYDYEAKGGEDFRAGRKDAALYDNTAAHGAAYRRGWQLARLASDDDLFSRPAEPEPAPSLPRAAEPPPATTIVAPEPRQGAERATAFNDPPALVAAAINARDELVLERATPDLALPIDPPPPTIVAPAEPVVPAAPDPAQIDLFSMDPDWAKTWQGMPAFKQNDLEPWASLTVHFASRQDRNNFSKLIGQTITDDTRSLWIPKAQIGRYVDKRFATEAPVNPRYPIYIISKGRADTRLTSKALEAIGVPYRIVVEPQELETYAAVIDRAKILVLPFSNLGQGSIPARNWVWGHAVAEGHARHWILDDNISGFYRLHNNLKTPSSSGATFAAAEDFVDRYTNVGIAGFNYFMFAPRKSASIQPFTLNTRIYSCILISHALDLSNGAGVTLEGPHQLTERWRGRYNEDTDLSIRALKAGWCTVLFNAFLAWKMTTMTMKGGNTEALYQIKEGERDGRWLMAESLRLQHPELVEIVWKWDRWQHSVNYGPFKRNELRLRPGVEIATAANDYGMKLEHLNGDGEPLPPAPEGAEETEAEEVPQ